MRLFTANQGGNSRPAKHNTSGKTTF